MRLSEKQIALGLSWSLSLLPLVLMLCYLQVVTGLSQEKIVPSVVSGFLGTLLYLGGNMLIRQVDPEMLLVPALLLVILLSLRLAAEETVAQKRVASCVGISPRDFVPRGSAEAQNGLEDPRPRAIPAESGIRTLVVEVVWAVRLSLVVFMVGVLSGVFAKKAGTLQPQGKAAVLAYLSAGFCEEVFKFIFIGTIARLVSCDRRALWSLSIAAALGFTTVENFIYFWYSRDIALLFVRCVFVVPLHVGWNLIATAGVVRRRPGVTWALETTSGLLLAILLHGTYDFSLYSSTKSWERLCFIGTVLVTMLSATTLWLYALPDCPPTSSDECSPDLLWSCQPLPTWDHPLEDHKVSPAPKLRGRDFTKDISLGSADSIAYQRIGSEWRF